MSSSKSVAAARNRRAEAPPPQYKNVKPTGPITSINTAGGAGLNARAQPLPQYQQQPLPQYQQQPQQYQQQQYQQQQQQYQEQGIPSKVTVANAIGLLTVRIARLEKFVHQYNLEQSGSQPKQGSQGNATDNVEARLDDSILRNIVTRLDNLEKDKKNSASANVNAPVKTQVITQVAAQPVAEDPVVIKLNDDLSKLKQEVKETEALLLKLQSFTMETNQKLVNMLFQDTNEISMTQLTHADCNYEYDPTCNDVDDERNRNGNDNECTSAIEVLDDIAAIDMQTASGNLKDLINEELARMPL
jgi:hypothetical protein